VQCLHVHATVVQRTTCRAKDTLKAVAFSQLVYFWLLTATSASATHVSVCDHAGSAHGKPSTAPLAGSSSLTPAAGGNATATLGLKRFGEFDCSGKPPTQRDSKYSKNSVLSIKRHMPWVTHAALVCMEQRPCHLLPVCTAGFKSRALRVDGAVQASADAQAPDAHAEVAPLAAQQPSEAAADTSAAGDADDGQDAATGRKRRAAAESVPSPSVSPKLAAAVRHGQQCRVQPGEEVRHSREGVSSCAQGLQVQGVPGSRPGARDRAPVVSQQPAEAVTSTDDDSVPLVGSKLAARAQDRGTPLAAGRGRDAGGCCTCPAVYLTPQCTKCMYTGYGRHTLPTSKLLA
jgi:hypothetical protein